MNNPLISTGDLLRAVNIHNPSDCNPFTYVDIRYALKELKIKLLSRVVEGFNVRGYLAGTDARKMVEFFGVDLRWERVRDDD